MADIDALEAKLRAALSPERMRLEDDSALHNVPRGSGSHWNLIVVSTQFEGRSLVERHRLVNAALAAELASGEVHALTMKTLTPAEWAKTSGPVTNEPPPCLGGSKA
jgi:BolA protein